MQTMKKRPHSVTVIGGLFLVAGVIGLGYHATQFRTQEPFPYELLWVCLVRLLAIICAAFVLRASNWARWLLVIWVAYHVILSGFHSRSQLLIHALLLAVVAYFLFRPSSSVYFRGGGVGASRPRRRYDIERPQSSGEKNRFTRGT
jgi:hypothetical protein